MIVDPNEENLKAGNEAVEFYAHLGRIMALWAEIEGYVFDLFAFATVIDRYKAALLFDRFRTLGTRLEVTQSILDVSLKESWLSKWNKVRADIDVLLPFRNHLAHNPVEKMGVVGGPTMHFRYFSVTDRRKIAKQKNVMADIGQLRSHLHELTKLRQKLSTLGVPKRARVRPAKPLPPRFPLALMKTTLPKPRKNRTTKASRLPR